VVAVANYNGGGQVVISGASAAVTRAADIAKGKGARRSIPLAVSGAFHSPLMVSAGDLLFHSLTKVDFARPNIPVVLNVTAEYAQSVDGLIGALTMQVSRSVLWEQSMRRLLSDGISTFIEQGSGEVLTGLMRRIDPSVRAMSIHDAESLHSACAALQQDG
jgi:[acyl-carrier-protein] S-malonyltransferase